MKTALEKVSSMTLVQLAAQLHIDDGSYEPFSQRRM